MASTFFLFLSDHVVSAYHWEKGAFDEGEHFENSESGQAEFDAYLDKQPLEGLVYILVDVTEEDLHNETVPKLMGTNKTKMLTTRSNRIFRNTPFHMGYAQGKIPGEKNKEKALFIGLTETDRILAWLNLLKKRRAPIAGMVSVPVLCQEIFKKIDPADKDALLITPNSGGLRQVFLRNGRILVSRLSPIHSREVEGVQMFIHGEVSKMQGYLASLRLVNHNTTLDVYTLCRGSLYTLLESGREGISLYNSHPVDADALVRRLGVGITGRAKLLGARTSPANSQERLSATENLDPLFCYFLTKQRTQNHYARPKDLRIFHALRVRLWLRMASFAILLLGIVMGSSSLLDAFEAYGKLPQLSRLADQAQVALQSVALRGKKDSREGLLLPPDGGADLVVAVRTMDKVMDHAIEPQPFLLAVSQILIHHDTIWIDGIQWVAGMPEPPQGNKRGGRRRPEPGNNKPGIQHAKLQGHIVPFTGNFLAAQEQVHALVSDLRALPEVLETTILSLPEDPRQTAVLDARNAAVSLDQANFVLQITMQVDGKKHAKH